MTMQEITYLESIQAMVRNAMEKYPEIVAFSADGIHMYGGKFESAFPEHEVQQPSFSCRTKYIYTTPGGTEFYGYKPLEVKDGH
ncbi:hypothetical protein [Anaerotalea alkaliphila]|uniref:Uncharacterized protein n=1 Tax=Anaerotalea alkaliphila TaxID=2662126 RepID=A0A7X5HXK8_9FIRM|nr:hypothetical protein [Anaerotalea alkaliphila]NDL68485.1 hypothetical protein [Anaerotalea alkaliphila]